VSGRRPAAALAVLWQLAGGLAAPAAADEADAFYAAADLAQGGKPAEAVAQLEALVARAPDDPFADDALLEIGRLYEEKLGDPVKAAAAYGRLVHDFPQSRLAARARARAEALRAEMGPDARSARALAELEDVLGHLAARPRAESIARVEKLLADDPRFPGAPRALTWLGNALQLEGRSDEALRRYREVSARWPRGEWTQRARRAEGDLLLQRRDWDGAERAYRSLLSDETDPLRETAAAEALARLGSEHWRARGYTVSWLVLAAGLAAAFAAAWRAAGGPGRGARALARPPTEALYLLPVAGLFIGAGLTEHAALGHALETIAAGGVAIAWLSGAALEAVRRAGRRVSGTRAGAHALLAAAAVVALCYIALTRERLVDMLLETVKYGPD
jgi:TolA-binding protein